MGFWATTLTIWYTGFLFPLGVALLAIGFGWTGIIAWLSLNLGPMFYVIEKRERGFQYDDRLPSARMQKALEEFIEQVGEKKR